MKFYIETRSEYILRKYPKKEKEKKRLLSRYEIIHKKKKIQNV